ncbi:MAG: 39S ribosomal protein L51, mitochondrial [Thelocarpon impressellum]|nr:MAG: 39S ribosomal protein L51, mitochondrial [Thelocarpon impressellum]
MPVSGVRAIAKSRNGVSAFIAQCKRLDFHYCDWAGSSRGMNAFLRSPLLAAFARSHPHIELTVSPRPASHPIIRASYINGREKVVCVRNLEPAQVLQKAELLRDASGEKLRREKKPVKSGGGESVRGVWSGLHALAARDGKTSSTEGKAREGEWRI